MAVGQTGINKAAFDHLTGRTVRVARANYNVAVDGGAAGDYDLGDTIPVGAIIKEVTTREKTALAGGTSITFKVGAGALTAAIALAGFTGIDVHALTSVDGLHISTAGRIRLTTVGTFTAGEIEIFIEYYFEQ